MARPLFRPKNNHICHQNPNPSRETVPLSSPFSFIREGVDDSVCRDKGQEKGN